MLKDDGPTVRNPTIRYPMLMAHGSWLMAHGLGLTAPKLYPPVMPRQMSPLVATVTLAAVAVMWGAIPLFVRTDVPAAGLVGVRVTFGAITLLVGAAVVGRLRFPTVHRRRVALCGVLLTIHWVTFFAAIKLTTVAIALAIMYLGPIAAAILSGPILGERVSGTLWIALAVAATGTLFVVQPWGFGEGELSPIGIGMAALSGASLAAIMIVAKPAASVLGGLILSIGELTIASILLAPATVGAIAEHSDQMVNFLILGVVFTGLANLVYWEVYRVLPVASVSTIMYIEPASAVMWALAFLDEAPTPLTWLGVALVIVGGFMSSTVGGAREEYVVPANL